MPNGLVRFGYSGFVKPDEVSMLRSAVALLLAVLLGAEAFAQTVPAPQLSVPESKSSESKVSQIKSKVQKMPPGTPVTVKLLNGKKLKGRLVSASADGFSVQTLELTKITEKSIRFDQVDQLKAATAASKKMGDALFISGMAVGTALLALIILAAIGKI